ncbi:hypothetical protein NUSPORA_01521 [Nucleospora cyclopteri]
MAQISITPDQGIQQQDTVEEETVDVENIQSDLQNLEDIIINLEQVINKEEGPSVKTPSVFLSTVKTSLKFDSITSSLKYRDVLLMPPDEEKVELMKEIRRKKKEKDEEIKKREAEKTRQIIKTMKKEYFSKKSTSKSQVVNPLTEETASIKSEETESTAGSDISLFCTEFDQLSYQQTTPYLTKSAKKRMRNQRRQEYKLKMIESYEKEMLVEPFQVFEGEEESDKEEKPVSTRKKSTKKSQDVKVKKPSTQVVRPKATTEHVEVQLPTISLVNYFINLNSKTFLSLKELDDGQITNKLSDQLPSRSIWAISLAKKLSELSGDNTCPSYLRLHTLTETSHNNMLSSYFHSFNSTKLSKKYVNLQATNTGRICHEVFTLGPCNNCSNVAIFTNDNLKMAKEKLSLSHKPDLVYVEDQFDEYHTLVLSNGFALDQECNFAYFNTTFKIAVANRQLLKVDKYDKCPKSNSFIFPADFLRFRNRPIHFGCSSIPANYDQCVNIIPNLLNVFCTDLTFKLIKVNGSVNPEKTLMIDVVKFDLLNIKIYPTLSVLLMDNQTFYSINDTFINVLI